MEHETNLRALRLRHGLQLTELSEVSWLSDPTNAFIALVVVSVWQLSGYMILIYVAGF